MYQHNVSTDPEVNSRSSLDELHLAELRASAIPDDVITERGYRTIADPAELVALGFAEYQARPGLLLPLHDVYGRNSRFALKPNVPRVGSDGKVIKYEYPAGQQTILDVPVRCQPDLLDLTVDLWVTEGWKKADALAGAGKCVVTLAGVWNWGHDGGKPLDDWEPIFPTLDGRKVNICFDSDAATNRNVRQAEWRLKKLLSQHGAWVSIIRLPAGPNGEKVGVDDFLEVHGVDELEALAQEDTHALRAQAARLQQQQVLTASITRKPNDEIHASDKLVLFAMINLAGQHRSKGKSEFTLYNATIAGATGLSEGTVSSSITRIAQTGTLFHKRVTRTRRSADDWQSEIRITMLVDGDVLELLKVAATLKLDYTGSGKGTGKWGGKRQCPQHPNAKVVRRVSHVCSECGMVLEQSGQLPLKRQDAASDFAKWAESLDRQDVNSSADGALTEGGVASQNNTLPPPSTTVHRGGNLPIQATDARAAECRACGGDLSEAERRAAQSIGEALHYNCRLPWRDALDVEETISAAESILQEARLSEPATAS